MKQLSALLFTFACLPSIAQNKVLDLEARRVADNCVDIMYRKELPGSFCVGIHFTHLDNTNYPNGSSFTVNNPRGTLLTLRPSNKDAGIGYHFEYRFIRGALNPKIKQNIIYLLPFSPGIKVKAIEAGFADEKYFGAQKPADWINYTFYSQNQDTVKACRKGLVVEVVEEFNDEISGVVEYTSKKNYLLLEHEDGTIMRYMGFKKNSIFVQPGDEVLPGSALGISAAANNNYYMVNLLLYYLKSANFEILQNATFANNQNLYKTLSPQFLFNDMTENPENGAEYISASTEEIITKEMSKKELKKYKAQLPQPNRLN